MILFLKYACFVNVQTVSFWEPQWINLEDSDTASPSARKAPQIMGLPVQLPLFFLPETMMELFCKDYAQNKQSSIPGALATTQNQVGASLPLFGEFPMAINCVLSTACNKHTVGTNA